VQFQTSGINIDEAILIEQCRQGDSTAMETLILRYQNRIYNVILKMCGNPDDAAELSQDTFVKVIENINKFEARSSFYTWVFRIAVNLTINHCKKDARVELRSLDDTDDEHIAQARQALKQILADDSAADPAVVAQNRELCDVVIGTIMKLDEAQKAVLILRDIEGMNYAQIAEVLNIELGTVKSRLSRARCNLREILEAVSQ